jgi:hypothetical protein
MVLTAVAIALLLVYAADVAVIETTGNEDGFLPFDHKIRGMGLGLPALILPFIAYFISRKDPSKGLGAMIIVAGFLILFGGVFVIGNADPAEAEASGRDAMSEAGPLIIAGAVQIGLGILKIKKS